MFELRVKNLDRELLEIHPDVTFMVGHKEDEDTMKDFIEALHSKTGAFVTGLVLTEPLTSSGIRLKNNGFETSGLWVDAEGACPGELGTSSFRVWEIVYIEEQAPGNT